jgi:hypothetical protein
VSRRDRVTADSREQRSDLNSGFGALEARSERGSSTLQREQRHSRDGIEELKSVPVEFDLDTLAG